VPSPSTWVFLTFCQVLTGEQPFRNIKALELAYHVSSGVRPSKPENAEAIGISNALWNLIQRCWDGDKTQRPQIGEIVAGVGNAAANWHTVMQPSPVDNSDDSVEEESDELKHGESSLSVIVSFVLIPSVQLGYLTLIGAKTRRTPPSVRIFCKLAMGAPNPLGWKPPKSMLSLCSIT